MKNNMRKLFIVAISVNALAAVISFLTHSWVNLAINASMLVLLVSMLPRGKQ